MPTDLCTILLIDDSHEDRQVVRNLLQPGYAFHEARTGAEGLAMLAAGEFDCVLLNQNLPDASGLDVLLESKRRLGNSAPPTVLLTGSSGEPIGPRALQCGARDFLPKDEIGAALLQRTIQHARERHRFEQDRQETEEQLRATVKELVHSNEETRVFAYALAHDLRAPIRTVSIFTQLLAADLGEPSPKVRGHLRHIQTGMRRMDELVQSLDSFVCASKVPDSPAQGVPLLEAMQDCLSNLQAQIQASNAIIRFSSLPGIIYHRTALVQLLQNLIENAIKYRKAELAPEIEIHAFHDENEVRVAVRDNGQGFDQKYAERIFEAFQRLHGTTHAGSGLGLAACRRIVSRFGGRIWAESTPGVGSTFHFSIPKHLVIEPMAAQNEP